MALPINTKAEVWSDNVLDLYEEAVSRQRNATRDIPWTELPELDPDLEHAMSRYRGWACSEGTERFPRCGSMLWRPPAGDWVCSACRLGAGERGARCPKVERARRAAARP